MCCRSRGRSPGRACGRCIAQLLDAARVLHRRKVLLCGLNPEIIADPRSPRPVMSMRSEGVRLMISTGGIGRAQDLLATLNERTLRGVSLDDIELRYIAPELLTGGAMDVRSDIFTIGVIAYEMATGKPPFDGASMQELLGRMLSERRRGSACCCSRIFRSTTAAAILRALSSTPADS